MPFTCFKSRHVVFLGLLYVILISAEKKWTYTFNSIEGVSTNEEMASLDLKVARLGRNEYAIAGTCNIDFDAPESSMIEITTYRSLTGNSDYKPLPFKINRQDILSFMNGPYKDIIMKNFKDCSNMPYFEDKFALPFERALYKFDNCVMDISDMPEDVPAGFYKVLFTADAGDVQINITGIAKIENKVFN